jgi:YHS domain-containing protein
MDVDSADAARQGNTYEYKGTKYFFCSRKCRADFIKEPGKYLAERYAANDHHE